MRPRLFIPLAVLADLAVVTLLQVPDQTIIDPVLGLLSELPTVALMIWLVMKLDERHRESVRENREYYRDLLTEVMQFMRDVSREDKD